MGEISKALATEGSVEFQGKAWKLSAMTVGVQGEFEVWLEERAWDVLRRSRRWKTDQEDREDRAKLLEDITAGKYSFFSRACLEAQAQLSGMTQMIFLRLRAANPGDDKITADFVRQLVEEKLEEVQATLAGMDADPNRNAPAPAGAAASASPPSAPVS